MRLVVSILLALLAVPAFARGTSPQELLDVYSAQARQAEPGFTAVASRGEAFFRRQNPPRPGAENPLTSCADCHTADPRQEGLNKRSNKKIEPMAPTANSRRFSDTYQVEKWFNRNCGDVLDRPCTAMEKADLIAWLMTLK
jgi:cytochrome c553